MKLELDKNKNDFLGRDACFVCPLTLELTMMLMNHQGSDYFYVYLMEYDKHQYAIRVPGCTIGYVRFNDEHIIEKIEIYRRYFYSNPKHILCYYKDLSDIEEILKRYTGQSIHY